MVIQVEISPLLTLNTLTRAIGDFLAGLGVQSHPNRKATRRVFSNYLDARNGLTTGQRLTASRHSLRKAP